MTDMDDMVEELRLTSRMTQAEAEQYVAALTALGYSDEQILTLGQSGVPAETAQEAVTLGYDHQQTADIYADTMAAHGYRLGTALRDLGNAILEEQPEWMKRLSRRIHRT